MAARKKTQKLCDTQTQKLRARLREPAKNRMTLASFFKRNLAAKEFVELWMVMAGKGDSNWPVTKVHVELMREHGMPCCRELTNFKRSMENLFGDGFVKAYEETR